MMRVAIVLTLTVLWVLPSLGAAEIKTRVRADGSIEVYNEPSKKPATSRASAPNRVHRDRSEWDRSIRDASDEHSLDPKLIRSVIEVESGFNPAAVSSKGAQGLMQLMPETARELAVSDPFDPEQSIFGGTLYLRRMMDEFGRIEIALAAYNAGPGAVRRHGGIPPYTETRDYVRKVMTLYRGVAPVLPEPVRSVRPGRKVYLRVGPDNEIIMTTTPVGE
ncbi:MAG: lytic transglycosylase domain-containing protein [Thermoanaerobaculia bacterium]|nr:lytic transglycosylase domain-containing protein [Thermoanaerobaculia bacterium]